MCGSWHTGHGTFLALEFSPRGRPRPREALPPARPPRLARPPPRPPPPPRPNANTGAGAFERPVLLRNDGAAASDETAAARVPQSCTPGREAAALAAGRAARAASAAAIVSGTLLSPALFAIRPLSDSSAAVLGRDISSREAPNHHDAVALRPLPRQEPLRDASELPAPAVDRRQLRTAGRGQRRRSRAAPTARGDAALAAAWLCRTRPTRRSEAAPVARCGEPAGRRAAKKWPGKRPKRPVGRGRCWLAQHERVLTAHAGSRQRSIPRTATCRLFWLFASRRRFSVNRNG